MPYKSAAQEKLMRAVAHGWRPSNMKGPSKKVARKFVRDSKPKGYFGGGLAQVGRQQRQGGGGNVSNFLFEGRPPPAVSSYGQAAQGQPKWMSDYTQGIQARGNAAQAQPYQPYGGPRMQQQGQWSPPQFQQQRALQDAHQNFQQQRNYPQQNVDRMSQQIRSLPYGGGQQPGMSYAGGTPGFYGGSGPGRGGMIGGGYDGGGINPGAGSPISGPPGDMMRQQAMQRQQMLRRDQGALGQAQQQQQAQQSQAQQIGGAPPPPMPPVQNVQQPPQTMGGQMQQQLGPRWSPQQQQQWQRAGATGGRAGLQQRYNQYTPDQQANWRGRVG